MAVGCPYKGLASFDDSDHDVQFFFGREREREIICANLMASKLTVLYGDTGVGKSSVLRAGVAHSLRARPEPLGVLVFDTWKDDPAAELVNALAATAGIEPRATLADTLEACSAKLGGDIYVILDGVEEYFLYHEGELGPGTFAFEFPEAVKRPGLRASFLLAVREDALAKLDRFKASIPNLFGNYLRLEHLDREAARRAVLGPVERYNELVDASLRMDVEPELVESVLDEVVTGRVEVGQAGRGAVRDREPAGDRIEAPYLQLVMQALWEAEEEAGSHVLRASTLRELGGAEAIVRAHLEGALDSLTAEQRDIASAVFDHLVTPSGTKIAHTVPDLARYAGVDEAALEPVMSALSRERILRPAAADGGAPRYEIYHDVLGETVLAWRTGHESERKLIVERQAATRRQRRLLTALGAGGVLLAMMAGVTVYAVTQRDEAQAQARNAQARQLDSAAINQLAIDPELSLALAAEAARLSPTPQAEETLRTASILSRQRAIFSARGPVNAAEYSPDGTRLLVASEDGSARLFDTRTRKRLLAVTHGDAVLVDASLSADGTRLVTAGHDGTARVWDVATGGRLWTVRHGGPVRSAAIDPTGSLVVTAGGRSAKIWRQGDLVATLPWNAPVAEAAFSPGGRLVLVTGNDSVARLYDAKTGKLVRALDQGGRVTSAAFGPGGGLLVTTGANETARIWRVRDGKLRRELKGHRGSVLDAAFSPRGYRLATASADGTGRIWDVQTGVPVASVGGHKGIVESVAFSPDGNFVVTGSTDRTARVAKADNGDGRALLAGHGDSVHTVAFSPDGSAVLTASADGTARIWDPAIQPQLGVVRRTGAPLAEAEYVGRQNLVIVAGPGWRALVMRADDGRLVRSIRARGPVQAVAATRDGKLLAVAGGRAVSVVRPEGPAVQLLHAEVVTAVAFAPDGGRIVTGGAQGTGRIWSVDGKLLDELGGHKEAITDVEFSSDGAFIATSSRDKTARIWSVDGKLVRSLRGHRDDVTSVAFSPDGQLVLTASRDHDGRLWDVETGALAQVLRAHFGEVSDASFSPDGRWILTAGPGTALLWQPGVQAPILPYGFGGHTAPLTSAVFDPAGRTVLTASRDGTVRTAQCEVCRGLDDLLEMTRAQLAGTGRMLTAEERERYGL